MNKSDSSRDLGHPNGSREPFGSELAELVKKWRAEANVSIDDCVEYTRYTRRYFEQIESGQKTLTARAERDLKNNIVTVGMIVERGLGGSPSSGTELRDTDRPTPGMAARQLGDLISRAVWEHAEDDAFLKVILPELLTNPRDRVKYNREVISRACVYAFRTIARTMAKDFPDRAHVEPLNEVMLP